MFVRVQAAGEGSAARGRIHRRANLLSPLGVMLLGLQIAGSVYPGGSQVDPGWAARRKVMVVRQIEARGVRDPLVLGAMAEVPRHLFVPAAVSAQAYEDYPLPIGEGQTISQPYIVALMTECLDLEGGEKVLEVGTGSGYQAAVLGRIAGEVFSIEINGPLARRAESTLEKLGYDNVHVRVGDGFFGWPEEAPFDAVIVTAAAPEVPPALFAQLAEGGRLVLPLGDPRTYQRLTVISKRNGKPHTERILDVRFVPMTGEIQKKKK
jgi:protein-L-isoaspartate(D-aspartate) O-methyltransferase